MASAINLSPNIDRVSGLSALFARSSNSSTTTIELSLTTSSIARLLLCEGLLGPCSCSLTGRDYAPTMRIALQFVWKIGIILGVIVAQSCNRFLITIKMEYRLPDHRHVLCCWSSSNRADWTSSNIIFSLLLIKHLITLLVVLINTALLI